RKSFSQSVVSIPAAATQTTFKLDSAAFNEQLPDPYEFESTITIPIPPGGFESKPGYDQAIDFPIRALPATRATADHRAYPAMTNQGVVSRTCPASARSYWLQTALLAALLLLGSMIGMYYFSAKTGKHMVPMTMIKTGSEASMITEPYGGQRVVSQTA